MDFTSAVYASAALQATAVVLQIAAAVVAFRLIRLTGWRISWLLISGALCVMAIRRSISIGHTIFGGAGTPLLDESVAVLISVLMLAGVLAIGPLFLTVQRAAETLRRAKEDLEVKVAERTEDLREANLRLAVELHERRQAEIKLTRYAQDLARSNAELEQFAYVASHDLQEPLRMVSSFTQLLAKRYGGRLDRDADEFIAFAVDGASRMQTLLHDLLLYSRVGTRGKPFAPVDANRALQQALDNLAKAVEESGAAVSQDPLPIVAGDEVQLIQLFQNLVGNAIKFHGPHPPRIHVSAQKEDSRWIFSVQDSGIGIAPEHRELIFSIFQRLHPRSDYPGTGIGLAICKKIVERHQGSIWVESQPGKGSTFYFNLPEGEGK